MDVFRGMFLMCFGISGTDDTSWENETNWTSFALDLTLSLLSGGKVDFGGDKRKNKISSTQEMWDDAQCLWSTSFYPTSWMFAVI